MTARRSVLLLALCLSTMVLCLAWENDDRPTAPVVPNLAPADLPVLRTLSERYPSARDLAFSADGRVLLVIDGRDSALCDVETGKRLAGFDAKVGNKQLGGHGFGTRMALSPDGRVVALDHRESRGVGLAALDADSGKLLQNFFRETNEDLICSAFSPDSAALVAGYHDGVVRRLNMATGKVAWELAPLESVWRIAFAPNGKTVAVGFVQGPACLLDAASGQLIGKLHWPGGDRECTALAYSPDAKLLATAGSSVQIWDVASAKLVRNLPTGGDAIGFSPDSRTLVVWWRDGPIQLFEVASGKLRREIAVGKVGYVRFSPAATLAAIPTPAGAICLCDWRADGRKRQARLTPDEAKQLWENLASDDAAAAWQAVLGLAAAPEQAAEMLGRRVRPPKPAPAPELQRLIAQLDDDDFDKREEASRRLAALGEVAWPALHEALANEPPPELRRRAKQLLARLDRPPGPEEFRKVRAVEALEYAGSGEARSLLKEWASGAEGALLTDEARAALGRLEHKPLHSDP